MSHLQASRLFSVQDRVVVITGGGSGKKKSSLTEELSETRANLNA